MLHCIVALFLSKLMIMSKIVCHLMLLLIFLIIDVMVFDNVLDDVMLNFYWLQVMRAS